MKLLFTHQLNFIFTLYISKAANSLLNATTSHYQLYDGFYDVYHLFY